MLIIIVALSISEMNQFNILIIQKFLKTSISRDKHLFDLFILHPYLVDTLHPLLHLQILQMRHVLKTILCHLSCADKEFTHQVFRV